ncbi:MAG TPA: hypothetical protein DEF51_30295 [Myxococcales bacterium]|nr:hypothetical protein [Myxococcales bacterium]
MDDEGDVTGPSLAHALAAPQSWAHPLTVTYCPRCDEDVRVIAPWSGWPKAWRAWLGGLGVMAVAAPFVAWDFCVMQPSMMAYLLAGGIVRHHARARPVCRRCSLELSPR